MTLEERLESAEALAAASLNLLHELIDDFRSVGLLSDRAHRKLFRAAIDRCADHEAAADVLRSRIDPDGDLGL